MNETNDQRVRREMLALLHNEPTDESLSNILHGLYNMSMLSEARLLAWESLSSYQLKNTLIEYLNHFN